VQVVPDSEPPEGHEYDAVGVTVFVEDAGDAPTPFVAVTTHEYVLPASREETVTGEVALDAERVAPPSDEVHVPV
jgi:hypothetical protein